MSSICHQHCSSLLNPFATTHINHAYNVLLISSQHKRAKNSTELRRRSKKKRRGSSERKVILVCFLFFKPVLINFNLFLRIRVKMLHMHLTSRLLLCAEEARLRAEKEELERLERERKQAEIERLELKVSDT